MGVCDKYFVDYLSLVRRDVNLGYLWSVVLVSCWQDICKVFSVRGDHRWDQVVPYVAHYCVFIY